MLISRDRVPDFRTVTIIEAGHRVRYPNVVALYLRWGARDQTVVSYNLTSPNQELAFKRLLRKLLLPDLDQIPGAMRGLVGKTYTTFRDYEYDPRTNF